MKKYLAFGGAFAMAVLFPMVSSAASMQSGPNVSVNGTSVAQGNAYAAGGTVAVSGVVNGDLLVAGGTIVSSAKVNGDVMAAGGVVTLVNTSAQDVRVAGGNVTVGGSITGELFAAGGSVVVISGTTIAKDSQLSGGSVSFSGDEAGNLKISGANVYFDGTANGNITIDRATKVTVGPHAVIKGVFEYTASAAAAIDDGAHIAGTPIFHELQKATQESAGKSAAAFVGVFTAWWLSKLLILLTAAYLLWYLFRNDSLAVLDAARSSYGRSLLRGFIFFVVVPIASILAFITIIGAIPGVVALFVYGAILALTAPLAALFTAALLWKGKTDLHWHHILLGTFVIHLVWLVPVLGWIAYALVYLGVLGATVNILKGKFA